jgi:hypothetical protein
MNAHALLDWFKIAAAKTLRRRFETSPIMMIFVKRRHPLCLRMPVQAASPSVPSGKRFQHPSCHIIRKKDALGVVRMPQNAVKIIWSAADAKRAFRRLLPVLRLRNTAAARPGPAEAGVVVVCFALSFPSSSLQAFSPLRFIVLDYSASASGGHARPRGQFWTARATRFEEYPRRHAETR